MNMISRLGHISRTGGALVFLVGAGGWATGGQALTLEEATDRALTGSFSLEASREAATAASRRATSASLSRLPQVTGSIDATRSDHPVFVFGSLLGQQRFSDEDFGTLDPATGTLDLGTLNEPDPITNVRAALTARWTLWSGGTIGSRVRAASEGARAAESSYERHTAEVVAQTEEAYRRAYLAGHRLDVLRESLALSRGELARATRLFEEGLVLESTVAQLEAHVAEAEAELATAHADSVEARSLLALVMGRTEPVGEELEAPPAPGALPPLGEALARAGERPDVAAAEAAWRAERARVGEARGGLLPALQVMGSLEHNSEDPFGEGGTQWLVGGGVQWTLDLGTPHRLSAASAGASAAEAQHRAAVESARHEVRAAYRRTEAAAARATAMATAATAAEEAYRLTRRRHEEGLATTLELTESLNTLTRTRIYELAAMQEHGIALAYFRLAAGEPVSQQEESNES